MITGAGNLDSLCPPHVSPALLDMEGFLPIGPSESLPVNLAGHSELQAACSVYSGLL